MIEKHLVPSRGVNVSVRRVTSIKGDTRYTSWEILDYSSGRRVRHQRRTLKLAKAKAREIAEALALGKQAVLSWDALTLAAVRQALTLVSADEIVPACRAWRSEHQGSQLVAQRVREAVAEFLKRRDGTISDRRLRTDRAYLGVFTQKFGDRYLHEISTLMIKDWAAAKHWAAVMRNDVLQLLRTFYKDAIERGHAAVNAADIKREKIGGSDIKIFTPEEARRILNAVDDSLKPFFAMSFFSGGRKEELSRLTVEQVRDGMASGAIFLKASLTKTQRSRNVPLTDNLKMWLQRYLSESGMLLPDHWRHMEGLDQLAAYAAKKSGVAWVRNGPRHSFASYHLRLTGDPAETVKVMGNSLAQLDKHYASRADSITQESAAAYFTIVPESAGTGPETQGLSKLG